MSMMAWLAFSASMNSYLAVTAVLSRRRPRLFSRTLLLAELPVLALELQFMSAPREGCERPAICRLVGTRQLGVDRVAAQRNAEATVAARNMTRAARSQRIAIRSF